MGYIEIIKTVLSAAGAAWTEGRKARAQGEVVSGAEILRRSADRLDAARRDPVLRGHVDPPPSDVVG